MRPMEPALSCFDTEFFHPGNEPSIGDVLVKCLAYVASPMGAAVNQARMRMIRSVETTISCTSVVGQHLQGGLHSFVASHVIGPRFSSMFSNSSGSTLGVETPFDAGTQMYLHQLAHNAFSQRLSWLTLCRTQARAR